MITQNAYRVTYDTDGKIAQADRPVQLLIRVCSFRWYRLSIVSVVEIMGSHAFLACSKVFDNGL